MIQNLSQSAIDDARATDLVQLVESFGINVEKQGKDYFSLCPFHSEATPSFTIYRKDGRQRYYCMACAASGDAIQFVQDYEGLNFRAAVARIVGEIPASGNASTLAPSTKQSEPEEIWRPIMPVPKSAPALPDTIRRKINGQWVAVKASRRWTYKNEHDKELGHVFRFDMPSGGKEVLPLIWAASSKTGERQWRWLSFPKPRPIYGLERLAEHTGAQVLVVEGEKAADAARELLVAANVEESHIVVISWPGGGKAVKHVDWSPLKGRRVVLWPDADQKIYPDKHELRGITMPFLEQPGTLAMLDIWTAIKGLAEQLSFIMPPEGVPDGWDLADPCPSGFSLPQHIKVSSVDPATLAQASGPTPLVVGHTSSAPADELLHQSGVARLETRESAQGNEFRRQQQKDENNRIQELNDGAMFPSRLTVDEMVESIYWVAEGELVANVSDSRTMFLKFNEFCSLTAESVTFIEGTSGDVGKNPVLNAKIWKSDPRRKNVMTPTFRAGADIVCADPEGKKAVNMWRPFKRSMAKADISPFIEHLDYLFEEKAEREVFLDWLAHLEQRPGELPHYGWLHIASHTGCGRNWLASVLARIWRGYVAPNVDLHSLLDSPYNGVLSKRVLAIVDEIQAGDSTNYRHKNRLREMLNQEFRLMNPKFGRQYSEHNSCRWLVFSNHLNALPIDNADRRWRVVLHNKPPRAPEHYEKLYSLLNDYEFINSIAVFLMDRNISNFKPGERPPMNRSKATVVSATKTPMQQRAEDIVTYWPAHVITNHDVVSILSHGEEVKAISSTMRNCMIDVGAVSYGHQVKINGYPNRVWILREHDRLNQDSKRGDVSREAMRAREQYVGRVTDINHVNAQRILNDAIEKAEDEAGKPAPTDTPSVHQHVVSTGNVQLPL